MWSTNSDIARFRRFVWEYYKENGRNTLPWRKTRDPYKILVSEVMLQQTQVERVIPYYKAFLSKFPTVHSLSRAPLALVVKAWQGLGYNRRAKNMHAAAKILVKEHGGKFPKTVAELETLPGVGAYTARAIACFAYNLDSVLVETNIRTAIIYHFFQHASPLRKVGDAEIAKVLQDVGSRVKGKSDAREWYGALMDYGAMLKRTGVRLNMRTAGYKPQAKFKGSLRQARGAIIKALASGKQPSPSLLGMKRKEQLQLALRALLAEGLIEKRASRYWLAR